MNNSQILSRITSDYYKILIKLQECNNNLLQYISHLEKENHSLITRGCINADQKIITLEFEKQTLLDQNQSLITTNQLLIDQNVTFLLGMNTNN